MSPLLELRSVSKRYGGLKALHEVSFDVQKGTVFGLLGPNGAGKTTLLRLVTGILGPDSGSILLNGQIARGKVLSRIGYMPEERGLYRKMGVSEQLLYLARLKGVESALARQRIARWLERLQLSEWAKRPIEDLSKGMQQKVQFISTVLHEPELLILDEPFSGLDPISSQVLSDELDMLRQAGTTVILSTHRMEQVQELCPEIALLHRGRLLLHGFVKQIREQYKRHLFEVEYIGEPGALDHSGFEVLEQSEERLLVHLEPGFSNRDFLSYLLAQELELRSFREILPPLNEIFIQLIQESSAHA